LNQARSAQPFSLQAVVEARAELDALTEGLKIAQEEMKTLFPEGSSEVVV